MTANIDEIPSTVPAEIAGVIVDPNMGRVTAYQRAAAGDLPTIRFGKRVYVVTQKLSDLIGRAITKSDIERAEAIIRERNDRQTLVQAAAIARRKG